MKVYICLTVAQEIDGKNTLVKVDKASAKKESIDAFLSANKLLWVEKMPIQGGTADFACERHPYEFEVEE